MKIGMNLLLWTDAPNFRDHADLLRRIKQWGFDGVEFPVAPMNASDVRDFAGLCDELGLGRSTILALDAAAADPASPDRALRQAAVEQIGQALELTKTLGGSLLSGPMFQGLVRFSGQAPTPEEWGHAVETIRKAGEHAAELGIRIALEPLNRFEMYIVNTMADAVRFVQDVGLANVGLLADTHHSNIEEPNTAESWEAAAQHIFHVHISENHRGIPGSGHAIPPEVFRTLRKIGYDDWLTIEAFGQSVPGLMSRLHLWRPYITDDEQAARQGLEFIRKQLQAVRQHF
jgi:D-psicose/D-tagatose/L-ribulose 3-epimerase